MAVLTLLLASLASCGSDSSPTKPPSNHQPAVPSLATGGPADGTINVNLDAVLSWSCSDQDGDALTYDVHFGQCGREWEILQYGYKARVV